MSPHEAIDLLELNAELLSALKIAREYVVKVDGTLSFTVPEKRITYPDLRLIDRAIAKAEGRS